MPGSPDSASTSRSPRAMPWYWRMLEDWFQRSYEMETLGGDPDSLIAFNLFTHKGPELALRCGTVVRAGDRVMEVHFRREALLPLMADGSPGGMGLGLLRLGDRDIPRLARALAEDPRLQDVRALHALTFFYRGISRYGFEVREVEQPLVRLWFTWWQRLVMGRDHPAGGAHVRANRDKLVTKHIWLSRAALIQKYAPTPAAPPAPASEA